MALPALEETVYDLSETLNAFIYNTGIEFDKRGLKLIPVFSSLYLPDDVVQALTAAGIMPWQMTQWPC